MTERLAVEEVIQLRKCSRRSASELPSKGGAVDHKTTASNFSWLLVEGLDGRIFDRPSFIHLQPRSDSFEGGT